MKLTSYYPLFVYSLAPTSAHRPTENLIKKRCRNTDPKVNNELSLIYDNVV